MKKITNLNNVKHFTLSLYIGLGVDGVVHANDPVDNHEGRGHYGTDQMGNLGGTPQAPLVHQAGLLLLPEKLFIR